MPTADGTSTMRWPGRSKWSSTGRGGSKRPRIRRSSRAFATLRRGTSVPVASGEHFYGRWEVERYLQAGAVSVVQADPEWCGGISELVKICATASLHDAHV